MTNIHIPYKSFCWVIGTTSFRTAKLNLKIEEQLLLLNEFHRKISIEEKEWKWDAGRFLGVWNHCMMKRHSPLKDPLLCTL